MKDLWELLPTIINPAGDPRTIAILGCAYMEGCLQEAITANLPGSNAELRKKLFTGTGPLSTVAARIDLAKAMGILGANTHHNCVSIARIRNRFAHNYKIHSFDNPEVAKLVDELRSVKFGDRAQPLPTARPERFTRVLTFTAGGFANYLNPSRQARQSA